MYVCMYLIKYVVISNMDVCNYKKLTRSKFSFKSRFSSFVDLCF